MLRDFLDNLFDNPGGKLKRVIKVATSIYIVVNLILSCLIAIGGLVGGIILGAKINIGYFFLVLFGALVVAALNFVLGTFFAWLMAVSSYIVGENAENIEEIRDSVRKISENSNDGKFGRAKTKSDGKPIFADHEADVAEVSEKQEKEAKRKVNDKIAKEEQEDELTTSEKRDLEKKYLNMLKKGIIGRSEFNKYMADLEKK